MKILVVDDERAVRESLRRALELEGYDIELAADGNEALYRIETESHPDAVILDVLMPGMDGLDVCRTIRRAGNTVPVLMLTARTQVEDRVEGLDAGADDDATKPCALEELRARLGAWCRCAASARRGELPELPDRAGTRGRGGSGAGGGRSIRGGLRGRAGPASEPARQHAQERRLCHSQRCASRARAGRAAVPRHWPLLRH